MKIFLLAHTYLPAAGGIENYLREVGKELLRKGHHPIIICRRHLPNLPAEEVMEGIHVIRHPNFIIPRTELLSKPLSYSRQYAGWLEERDCIGEDGILCRHAHYGYALSLMKEPPPYIYLPAGILPVQSRLSAQPGNIKGKLFTRIWRKHLAFLELTALQKASGVMVLSRNMSRQLEEYYHMPSGKLQINPPGVDLERFAPRPPSPELIEKLGLQTGIPILLFLGRFSPEKNLIFLLKALYPFLKDERAYLLLVGDGPARKTLEKAVTNMGIDTAVKITGPVSDPEKYYPLADIFVSPALYEPFGQTILEAMASGLPVIALKSAPPGILTAAEEIIEENSSGRAIAEDAGRLRKAVEALLDSPVERSAMGRRGREICRERFRWSAHVSRLLESIGRKEKGNVPGP